MKSDIQSALPFLQALSEKSRLLIRGYFGKDIPVERKSDLSPVTQADRETERLLRQMIEKQYPDHGIVGEEEGPVREGADWVWVLDPIDGTLSFNARSPLFGTLIGLRHCGEPVLGAISLPMSDLLLAGDGKLTLLNGKPVRVSEINKLSEALLLATDLKAIEKHQNLEYFQTLLDRVRMFRTWGDCFGYTLVAQGGADIMLDPILNDWDVFPLIPVIEGAGGVISDWEGNKILRGSSCVAASPGLHAQVIRILNGG